MAALALVETAVPDPLALVRAWRRMRRAGFTLELDGYALVVSPADRLSDPQRAWLRSHKVELVALLEDAETLATALALAGAAGLWWREGTPADWTAARLLAAGEVLYATGRMVSRMGRRHGRQHAPAPPPFAECHPPAKTPEIASTANVTPIDREAFEERAAIMEYDGGLPRDEAEQKALALAMRAENRERAP